MLKERSEILDELDKQTSRKHQSIIVNIYVFFNFLMTFLHIWNKFDYDEVDVTVLAQLNLLDLKCCTYLKQDQFIYFLLVLCQFVEDIFS